MKPRNDKEREIAELSATLSPIEIDCWDVIEDMDMSATDCMCYNSSYICNGVRCGWGTYCDEVNFPVYQRVGNYDVWRIHQLEFRKRRPLSFPKTRMFEVAQVWFDEDGNKYVMRRKFRNTNAELWWFGSNMEFRGTELDKLNDGSYMCEHPTLRLFDFSEMFFQDCSRLKEQYNSLFFVNYYVRGMTCSNEEFLNDCISPKAEFFFKLNENFFFRSYGCNNGEFVRRANTWYESIKVANRHGYDWSSDFLLWTDMLGFINTYGSDTRNPSIICPTDLKGAHLMWQKRADRKREKIRQEKMLEEARKGNMQYLQSHGAYLAIAFGSKMSNLHFHVIQSAEEMVMEGIKMHHCVGNYWKPNKSDSIIFSCRTADGEREATIEVDTETMTIVQIRGVANAEPEHLDEINKTMLENMDVIRMAKMAANKLKTKRTRKALAV